LGYIIPIFKGEDSNLAQHHRGITLNNILAKIYSQILFNQLTIRIKNNETIINNQFGYQKGKGTTYCIFLLHVIIYKVIHSGQKLYSAFIDYEKCYDKINLPFLWQKLVSNNISTKMINAIKAMYSTVKSVVKNNNEVSDIIYSHQGVKQGDCGSSLLLMVFVNGILNNIITNINDIT